LYRPFCAIFLPPTSYPCLLSTLKILRSLKNGS
jgi:hypothetical protein